MVQYGANINSQNHVSTQRDEEANTQMEKSNETIIKEAHYMI